MIAIGDRWAIIAEVADAIVIAIDLSVIGDRWADIIDIRDTIFIGILGGVTTSLGFTDGIEGLFGIRDARAIVAEVADLITVDIGLLGVGKKGAIVASVPDAIEIGILLVGVRNRGTVIAVVRDGVFIDIPGNGCRVWIGGIRKRIGRGGRSGEGLVRSDDDALFGDTEVWRRAIRIRETRSSGEKRRIGVIDTANRRNKKEAYKCAKGKWYGGRQ